MLVRMISRRRVVCPRPSDLDPQRLERPRHRHVRLRYPHRQPLHQRVTPENVARHVIGDRLDELPGGAFEDSRDGGVDIGVGDGVGEVVGAGGGGQVDVEGNVDAELLAWVSGSAQTREPFGWHRGCRDRQRSGLSDQSNHEQI